MDVSSVGSSSQAYGTNAATFRNFRNGQGTISEDDLDQITSQMESSGMKVPDLLQKMQSNFKSIDTNGNGISYDELQTYAKANGLSLPKGPPRGDGQDGPQAMTKDDLVKMRDKIAATDSKAADGITQVIDQFDAADTNKDGKVDGDEMQAFAKANNITMPKPHGGHHHGGSVPAPTTDDQSSTDDSDDDSLLSMVQQIALQSYGTYGANSPVASALGVGVTA